ncbi:polyhydroxyalkanoate synthesis repressor PhaR [Hyphomicrobium sp. CS1GBMeth3]|uniref:polyhydroxyalkanoate synthesis repressor PhaR n=1 Tax=Hyphomicrobium sp. CS1GBMeth3 TaxID=1892845 RepID=UPI0009314A9E|nr:polyhydroxyalkanoate synthesis repressor PhaR [Hyphomicrobium sp. CS1GBMeth3]
MAQPMLNKSDPQPEKKEAVVIKKYANRRLYNTETSTYVTLEDLAQMVRNDKDFVVYDAKSGDDLTHAVLTQIIVEQESREGGQTLLPIPFLRQLIRFYDDNIGTMVPSYLQFSLEALVKEQEKFRSMFASAFANPAAAFEAYQDQARKNMAMFEQAMAMWTSFGGAASQGKRDDKTNEDAARSGGTPGEAPKAELDELKAQLSAMQQRIDRLAKDRE